jgi:cytochrome c-type biogenesis protein CcmH/NrfF
MDNSKDFPKRIFRNLFVLFSGYLLISLTIIVAVRSEAAEDRGAMYNEFVYSIMSPVCPGKVLHACPSAEGAQLRELVRQKVYAGESKEKIIQYFVDVYGPQVMPTPPVGGFFLTAWGLPFAAVLAGLGMVFMLIKAWTYMPAEYKSNLDINSIQSLEKMPEDTLQGRLKREIDEFKG